jgi:hypothetical protein
MREELQIASELPDGLARRRLATVAEERAAIYVHRRVGSAHGPRFHLVMAGFLSALIVAGTGLASVSNVGPMWLQVIVDIAFLAVLVLLGISVALWATESWRDYRAEMRRMDLQTARKRLGEVDDAPHVDLG